MKIHDISMEISEDMPVYKNKEEKKPKIEPTYTIGKFKANESMLHLDSHTGTHVDAPFHFIQEGTKLNKVPIEKFAGPCIVIDLTGIKKRGIEETDLKNAEIKKDDIVILKTSNSLKEFDFEFVALAESGAKYLISKNIKSVGINSLGIERSQKGYPTHNSLLKNNIIIFEGLELSKVKPGRYFFACLPLKIKDGDASPARAILIEGIL
ncbi:MAG TPA: cyclase family protein [Candidatus Woesearchaeota archaeon]|jgi:arylformamidase|nr:cyclase family protein [Candidatus Woesearchaeota archaeon]HJN56524.1 cyclase family protein [Candidatus Woesearchaeota archaeon]|tara:strand:+ start:15180 stop:15806 length:627 start_codon:yes stop_codon:yes gene_type:complete